MRAKQIYEFILEAYEQSPLEKHRRLKFKSGPFKGYEMGDIVDKLPYTMSQLYIDMVPEDARGDMFKDSLNILLRDAQSKGNVNDDKEFRSFFPNLYNDLIRYGRNAGYTLRELNRYKPETAMNMATGGERIADNRELANKMRQQMGMDNFSRAKYTDSPKQEPEVKYKDPTIWAKGKRIMKDLTCIIETTNAKLIKTRYEGDELDVELQLFGVTTDGYPVVIYTLASKLIPEFLMYAENLTKEYTPISEKSLMVHMAQIDKAINDGVHRIDGKPYVKLQVNPDNISLTTDNGE